MKEKVAAPVYKTEINDRAEPLADHATPIYPQKLTLKFT
jgi:hypothetical protein